MKDLILLKWEQKFSMGGVSQCSVVYVLTVTFIGFLMDDCCRSCNTFTLSVNGITRYL